MAVRLLVVIGSGETSPTMVNLHQELVRRIGRDPVAVIVETPYGFQENADEVSNKARRYFEGRVGLRVRVAPGLRAPADNPEPDLDRGIAALRSADWAFIGPGSPSYAIRQLRGSRVGLALRDRLGRTGATIFSSAAACTLGRFTLPVYEIYKVGMFPGWLEGLDLLAPLGLDAAVIPHYDNLEGGTHDTRYCYVGERRLRMLERQLPATAAIVGIDEHTAAIFDLEEQTVALRGRGGLTVRRGGYSERLEAERVVSLSGLRELVAGTADSSGQRATPPPGPPQNEPEPGHASLAEATRACELGFDQGIRARDASAMLTAILDLEQAITDWSTDTLESGDVEHARTVLRSLIVRLGDAAREGLQEPESRLAPLVEPLLSLRQDLRGRRAYELADAVREALAAGGIEVRDTPGGTSWSVA
jgi:hypothetical protein